MELGAFSVSLSVKDLTISRDFYQKLGFQVIAGQVELNFLVMKNGSSIIGIFQDMFQGNILTFNPGWDENGKELPNFMDIREIQNNLKAQNVKLDKEIDPNSKGRASFVLTDPDGNVILIDQHVD